MSFRRPRAALASLLTLPLVLLATPAQAHDRLVGSDPADGAVLDAVPEAIVLTYSAEPIDLSQEVHVTTPDGEVLTDLEVAVEGTTVTAALPDGLGGGEYAVAWRVVSSDGHPIEGAFAFTVDAPPAPEPTAEPEPTDEPEPEPAVTSEPTDEPTDEAVASDEGGAPVWPAIVGGGVLVGVVAAVLVLRARRRQG